MWCTLIPTSGLPSIHAATAPVYAGEMRVLMRRMRGGCGASQSSIAQMLPETAACARNKHLVPEIAASSGEIEGVIVGNGAGAPGSADAGAETPMREMLRRLHTLRVDAESNVSASSAVLEEEKPSEAVTQVSIITTLFVCRQPCLCSAFASSNVQQVFDSSGACGGGVLARRRRAPPGLDQSHADKERVVMVFHGRECHGRLCHEAPLQII